MPVPWTISAWVACAPVTRRSAQDAAPEAPVSQGPAWSSAVSTAQPARRARVMTAMRRCALRARVRRHRLRASPATVTPASATTPGSANHWSALANAAQAPASRVMRPHATRVAPPAVAARTSTASTTVMRTPTATTPPVPSAPRTKTVWRSSGTPGPSASWLMVAASAGRAAPPHAPIHRSQALARAGKHTSGSNRQMSSYVARQE